MNHDLRHDAMHATHHDARHDPTHATHHDLRHDPQHAAHHAVRHETDGGTSADGRADERAETSMRPWLFRGRPGTVGTAVWRASHGEGPDAVLFDRDGTLIVDVPYNGDPRRVLPFPGAWEALARLRALGIAVGVVSNQSGVARGYLTRRQVQAVHHRVSLLLGPFGVWAVCPHGPEDGCGCRKPAPGLVLAACARLGARPSHTFVIGDIGSDMGAARAAGAHGVLVPTPATLPAEIAAAPRTAPDLRAAVRIALETPLPGSLPAPAGARSGRARPAAPVRRLTGGAR
ncbi:D-glycero-alpha-D-manno-heptose-1,7-bisphosphate 7-phosphatase [Streptomyces sp. NPDC053431]|uniref:D-glycero-alpha-D-manno-heptose-1,7-bisphosphate 7-phosphatase n=1 Tax=Streptomyces sp. NPDC053431 TaxID=3365703 RepID=UPI0037D0782A